MLKILAAALCLAAMPAAAQQVLRDCSGWQASARNIPEPWEAHSRTFANGNVRLALLDTIEPALGAFYLMIVAPPRDELGSRACTLITENDGSGFAGLDFARLHASYDPAAGLTFRLPVRRFVSATGGTMPGVLAVTVNQATGTVRPWVE